MTDLREELKSGLEGEKTAVLDKICEEIYTKPKQPNEFTVTEVMERTGMEFKAVEYRLKKLEREGVLISRKPSNERFFRYADGEEADG